MLFIPKYKRGMLTLPDGAKLPYMMLGDGQIPIVLIPGAGDGTRTVYDAALNLAFYFRKRQHRYRMLLLSRRQPIPADYGVEQHAGDMIRVVDQLKWGPAIWETNSGGGPIGQWVAIMRPDLVQGLILSSTLAYTNEHTRAILQRWDAMARKGNWFALNWSSIVYTFRPQTVAKYRLVKPLLRLMPPPRYPARMSRVLQDLFYLDNRSILPQIACPTLVIGGADDRIIPAEVQRNMAESITDSRIKLYPGYGHGNDQGNPDYNVQVDRFVQSVLSLKVEG